MEHGEAGEKIALIEIQGVIGGPLRGSAGMVDLVRDQLDRIASDPAVKAVVLRVDSPGGEVLASDEIHDAVRQFQDRHQRPVVASMGSLAASGGYYVSAPCRWIVAHPLTLTGSIGVIFHGYNYRGLLDKVGIRPEVVKSGRLKDMLRGDRLAEEELPEEKAILRDLIRQNFDRFKQVIQEGRGGDGASAGGRRRLAGNWEEFADGRILSGVQAYDLGLVDELGSLDAAVARARTLAGIGKAHLVTYRSPSRLSDLVPFLGIGASGEVRIRWDGWTPAAGIPEGRLYFLSPLHVH